MSTQPRIVNLPNVLKLKGVEATLEAARLAHDEQSLLGAAMASKPGGILFPGDLRRLGLGFERTGDVLQALQEESVRPYGFLLEKPVTGVLSLHDQPRLNRFPRLLTEAEEKMSSRVLSFSEIKEAGPGYAQASAERSRALKHRDHLLREGKTARAAGLTIPPEPGFRGGVLKRPSLLVPGMFTPNRSRIPVPPHMLQAGVYETSRDIFPQMLVEAEDIPADRKLGRSRSIKILMSDMLEGVDDPDDVKQIKKFINAMPDEDLEDQARSVLQSRKEFVEAELRAPQVEGQEQFGAKDSDAKMRGREQRRGRAGSRTVAESRAREQLLREARGTPKMLEYSTTAPRSATKVGAKTADVLRQGRFVGMGADDVAFNAIVQRARLQGMSLPAAVAHAVRRVERGDFPVQALNINRRRLVPSRETLAFAEARSRGMLVDRRLISQIRSRAAREIGAHARADELLDVGSKNRQFLLKKVREMRGPLPKVISVPEAAGASLYEIQEKVKKAAKERGITVTQTRAIDRGFSTDRAKGPNALKYRPDQIQETWRTKRWTNPPVGSPLPEDTFKSIDELIEFGFEHERQHNLAGGTQAAGETLDQFEDRITRQTLEALKNKRPVAAATSGAANVIRRSFITREMVKKEPDKIFLFGDNLQGKGFGGQAKAMRGLKNAIGIPTKKAPSMAEGSFFTDAEYDANVKAIDKAFDRIPEGKTIVIPKAGLGSGRAQLAKRAPKTMAYLMKRLKALKGIAGLGLGLTVLSLMAQD